MYKFSFVSRTFWSTFGYFAKEETPQISVYGAFSCLKHGAEGQSRTDTGSPPPVFECGSMRSVNWCHVLRRADFEAKTSPNLVPRVARW